MGHAPHRRSLARLVVPSLVQYSICTPKPSCGVLRVCFASPIASLRHASLNQIPERISTVYSRSMDLDFQCSPFHRILVHRRSHVNACALASCLLVLQVRVSNLSIPNHWNGSLVEIIRRFDLLPTTWTPVSAVSACLAPARLKKTNAPKRAAL